MAKIKIPNYSLGEELFNAISHGIGVGLAIAGLVLAVVRAAGHHSPTGVVCAAIYGASMIIMYLISCLYHSFSPRIGAKKVFRILDHCDIYIFIAGCYTPFCLSAIGGGLGWTVFGVEWACTVCGVLFNAINMEKFKKISFVLYLIMGWMIVFTFSALCKSVANTGLFLLLSGGIMYTLGAVLYLIGAKRKYFHTVFHFFILAASVLQFFSIFLYVI